MSRVVAAVAVLASGGAARAGVAGDSGPGALLLAEALEEGRARRAAEDAAGLAVIKRTGREAWLAWQQSRTGGAA